MATSASTIAYLLDQLSGLSGLSVKKMFGEYCLYVGNKVVALVCDDRVFVKPTPAGLALLGEPLLNPPYKGAKPHYELPADVLESREQFAQMVLATARALPEPKPKTKKISST
jgi:DNA transformation protein and related proteins